MICPKDMVYKRESKGLNLNLLSTEAQVFISPYTLASCPVLFRLLSMVDICLTGFDSLVGD